MLSLESEVFFPQLLKMLEGKAVVRETDMPEGMQSYVMELAHQALDAHEVSDCQSIAHFIKQVNLKISHPFNSIFSGCLRNHLS